MKDPLAYINAIKEILNETDNVDDIGPGPNNRSKIPRLDVMPNKMPNNSNLEERGSGIFIDPRGLQDGKIPLPAQELNEGGIATPKRGFVDEPGSYAGDIVRKAGDVGSIREVLSKIDGKPVGYVVDIKSPGKGGARPDIGKTYYGIKEFGDIKNAEAEANKKYNEVIQRKEFRNLQGDKQLVRREEVVKTFLNYLENNEFDGYEKLEPELEKYKGSDGRFEQINKDFKEWKKGKFEVEGIDRKNLSKEARIEIKNWSPKPRGDRTLVRQNELRFLNELNNNQDISPAKVKAQFKKQFGKGKYYSDITFDSRIQDLTKIKREGSFGDKRLTAGIEVGERAPWLKKALSENISFGSNYSRIIRAADVLESKGKTKEAKRLYSVADKFFGSNGVLTNLPGQAEHPLSVTYGGTDNLLKVDSLVKGDLNQLKRVVFDTPLKKLRSEYNKSGTTPGRRNEIKNLLENRKSFMNYLTSGSVDKGIAQSVNFNFTPTEVTFTSSVKPIDKVGKNYDFGTFVKKGEEYSKVFAEKGKELNLITKGGLAKRTAVSDKAINQVLLNFCPRAKKSAGASVTKCTPQEAANNMKKKLVELKQGKLPIDEANKVSVNLNKVAKVGARVGTKGALATLGPLGVGGDFFIEGMIVANDYLGGMPGKEAWFRNWMSIPFGGGTDKADALQMERIAGTEPAANRYKTAMESYNKLIKLYDRESEVGEGQLDPFDLTSPGEYNLEDALKAEDDIMDQTRSIIKQKEKGEDIFNILKQGSPEQQAFERRAEVENVKRFQIGLDQDPFARGIIERRSNISPALTKSYAGGGLAKLAGERFGQPPEAWPTPQGLAYILKRDR